MTPDQIYLVIEFLWINGQLTAPTINGYYTLTNKSGTDQIEDWHFPEPALTVKQLKETENSTEFQDYLFNRDKILAEKELAKALENPALKVVLEENRMLKKQVNELTKLLQTSKDIAEINTEAAKLEPLPEKVASAESEIEPERKMSAIKN